ncbi:hypothetical protein [Faecalispora jeddahensis]|uniref:hypothetical protein n=1 Tax=Faecalispora jeddahensis TaxID=1414721 RepID=UPI0011C9FBB9|nr:hypothetical protein [Faecalispora jeddahensis]MBE6744125.1 hypothetical protein [Oscillospiraceae bacterium]
MLLPKHRFVSIQLRAQRKDTLQSRFQFLILAVVFKCLFGLWIFLTQRLDNVGTKFQKNLSRLHLDFPNISVNEESFKSSFTVHSHQSIKSAVSLYGALGLSYNGKPFAYYCKEVGRNEKNILSF